MLLRTFRRSFLRDRHSFPLAKSRTSDSRDAIENLPRRPLGSGYCLSISSRQRRVRTPSAMSSAAPLKGFVSEMLTECISASV